MNRTQKFLLCTIAILLALASFYFFYYQKTPAYSLLTIQQSFKTRDLATFEKHVDLDKVLGNFFDDALEEQLQGMVPEEQGMIKTLAKLFKNHFVQVAKNNVLREFSTDKTAITKDQIPPDNDLQKTDEKTTLKDFKPNKMELKDIGVIKTEENIAHIAILLYDTKLQKDYTFTAEMTRLPDRTWQLVRLKNTNIYLKDLLGNKFSSMIN